MKKYPLPSFVPALDAKIEEFFARTGEKMKIIIFADPGKDPDDEVTFVAMKALLALYGDKIDFALVVANLKPAEYRARLARGTFDELGMFDTHVAVGTGVYEDNRTAPHEHNIPYVSESLDRIHPNGFEAAVAIMEHASDGGVIVVCQSGMTDFDNIINEYPALVERRVARVAIMGGVDVVGEEVHKVGSYFNFDASNNATFDWASAVHMLARLQELGVPTALLSRHTVGAVQLTADTYAEMAATGNSVGICLNGRYARSMQELWVNSCASIGDARRGTLPPRCNREWFIATFLGGEDPGFIGEEGSVVPLLKGFNWYDVLNLLNVLTDGLFEEVEIPVKPVLEPAAEIHTIVGVAPTKHGVKDVSVVRTFMRECVLYALSN